MYIAPGQGHTAPRGHSLMSTEISCLVSNHRRQEQGQTAPRGRNFDVNRKALSLNPFVASFKEISLKSQADFIHFFHDLIHVYSPGAGAYSPQGT